MRNLVGFFGTINKFDSGNSLRPQGQRSLTPNSREPGAPSVENAKMLKVSTPCSALLGLRYHISIPAAAKYAIEPIAMGMP
jgi:hypothetical protein